MGKPRKQKRTIKAHNVRIDPTAKSPCLCCGQVRLGCIGCNEGMICHQCILGDVETSVKRIFAIPGTHWWIIDEHMRGKWEQFLSMAR